MHQAPLELHLNQVIQKNGYAFLPYLAAGDPDWSASKQLVSVLIASGADSIEIGLPFTDPVADGPVLQRSFKRVLSTDKNPRFHIDQFFTFLTDLNKTHPGFPFLVMGYANVFFHMGFRKILTRLAELNVVGVVIPDIPYEEKVRLIQRENLESLLTKISWIDFITPTTTADRLDKICKQASGFLYFVSTKGVTGQSAFSLKPWKKIISEVRKRTRVPIITGFGIRNAEHSLEAIEVTDGFIIGSRIHEVIEQNLNNVSLMSESLKKEIAAVLPKEKHLMT